MFTHNFLHRINGVTLNQQTPRENKTERKFLQILEQPKTTNCYCSSPFARWTSSIAIYGKALIGPSLT